MKTLHHSTFVLLLFTVSTFVLGENKPIIQQVSSEGIRHSILICGKLTQLINEKNMVVW